MQIQPEGASPNQNDHEIDQFKLDQLMNQIKENQNLGMGVMAGLLTAIIVAIAWAAITAMTEYQIGFMAIGVGFAVGYAVKYFGNGVEQTFGIAGALCSLLGCLLGNLFVVCIFIAQSEGVEIIEIIDQLDMNAIVGIMVESFQPMDLLFYGFAIYYGYKMSFRNLTEQELASVTKIA